MSRFLKSQQGGIAVQAGARPPLVRDINVELWSNLNISYSGKSFQNGSIALLYARSQRNNRDSGGDTPDMLWASPLITKNDSTKPPWVQNLLGTLTAQTALGYEGPKSRYNLTAVTAENPCPTGTDDLILSASGTWRLQLVAETFDNLRVLIENLINIALFGDGWTPRLVSPLSAWVKMSLAQTAGLGTS